jgi:hypothetical protein
MADGYEALYARMLGLDEADDDPDSNVVEIDAGGRVGSGAAPA